LTVKIVNAVHWPANVLMGVRKHFVQARLVGGGAMATGELPLERADDVPPLEQGGHRAAIGDGLPWRGAG
jgi:hypothetical protein